MTQVRKTKVLPPVIVLGCMVIMWLLDKVFPLVIWSSTQTLGSVILACSFSGLLYCAWLFHKNKTAIKPFEETRFLILNWPYTWSRNPIYLLMIIFLFGWAFWLSSLMPFFAIPLFVAWIHFRFVLQEEELLSRRFQQDYLDYKNTVRRWL